MLKTGMIECSACRSKLSSPTITVPRAYDKHRSNVTTKNRAVSYKPIAKMVKRVQHGVGTLDVLKARNTNPFTNSGNRLCDDPMVDVRVQGWEPEWTSSEAISCWND